MTSGIYDVLVAGMGPVGASAAIFAGQAGLSTCVVDKSTDVFPLPRATHFDAEIMRLFQRAGLVDVIEPLVSTYNGGLHLGADGNPIRDFRVPASRSALGWFPHYTFLQPRLDQALRDAAAAAGNVDCMLGDEVVGVVQNEDFVTATLRHPDGSTAEVKARYVIACDGAASPIRKALDISLIDYGFEEPWIIVDVVVAEPDKLADHSIMYCDPARPATYIPQPGNNRRWEFMLLDGETAQAMETRESINQLLKAHVDTDELEIVRSAVYRFHGLITSSWRNGRIFLAGDSAHQTPPFYGQGMCHGIRDAVNLIWKLELALQDTKYEKVLDTYAVERHPHVKAIVDASVENGRYICILDPGEARERDKRLRERAAAGGDVTSFRSVIPGLEDGILSSGSHPQRGQLMIQPDVGFEGQRALLDEALGRGFSLVSTYYLVGGPELRWFRKELGGQVVLVDAQIDLVDMQDSIVSDDTGALRKWLSDNGAAAVIVRPDRYIFGVIGEPSATSSMIKDLRSQLLDGQQ
jgi:3-(3-hydroxy-phenyl)propionate hydroxylase